jgi:hypothetical protein
LPIVYDIERDVQKQLRLSRRDRHVVVARIDLHGGSSSDPDVPSTALRSADIPGADLLCADRPVAGLLGLHAARHIRAHFTHHRDRARSIVDHVHVEPARRALRESTAGDHQRND